MCNSKYQEALDILHGFANGNLIRETTCDYQRDKNDEYKDTLQELVDKATDKKPMHIKLIDEYRCKNCGFTVIRSLEKMKYCHNCGQKIDWSDWGDEE